jgi:hypothetical protein
MLKQTASHLMLHCEEVKNIRAAQDLLAELEGGINQANM